MREAPHRIDPSEGLSTLTLENGPSRFSVRLCRHNGASGELKIAPAIFPLSTEIPGPPNASHANLRGQGPRAEAVRRADCDARAAISGAQKSAGGVPPSILGWLEELQLRTEAGPRRVQREVSRPTVARVQTCRSRKQLDGSGERRRERSMQTFPVASGTPQKLSQCHCR